MNGSAAASERVRYGEQEGDVGRDRLAMAAKRRRYVCESVREMAEAGGGYEMKREQRLDAERASVKHGDGPRLTLQIPANPP